MPLYNREYYISVAFHFWDLRIPPLAPDAICFFRAHRQQRNIESVHERLICCPRVHRRVLLKLRVSIAIDHAAHAVDKCPMRIFYNFDAIALTRQIQQLSIVLEFLDKIKINARYFFECLYAHIKNADAILPAAVTNNNGVIR